MEERPAMDGSNAGYTVFSARNSRNGVPDKGQFNKRGSDNRVPKSDRSSRDSSRSVVDQRTRYWASETARLPNWYSYGIIALTTVTLLILMSML